MNTILNLALRGLSECLRAMFAFIVLTGTVNLQPLRHAKSVKCLLMERSMREEGLGWPLLKRNLNVNRLGGWP